jgi:hypothetical protein
MRTLAEALRGAIRLGNITAEKANCAYFFTRHCGTESCGCSWCDAVKAIYDIERRACKS